MNNTKKTAGETATTVTNLNDLVDDVKIAEELVSKTICEDANLDVWRDVEGFEGRYEVSLLGYIRFADKPDKRKVKCSIINDYSGATLFHRGEMGRRFKIHELVAKAFVPNPEGYTFVKHKNGILQDNRAENLEWVETEPKKRKKRKSKHTSKSALPILEVSDGEVFESGVAESEVSDGEEWKDVMGFEGLYKISRNGMVRSYWNKKPIYLSTMRASHLLAYQLIDKDGNRHCEMAHMLVAKHFIPNPFGYENVMHIDGNPHNNNIDNLRWTERPVRYRKEKSESYKKYAGRHNLMTTQEVVQYYTDGTYINTFKSITEAAEKTKCSYGSIKAVLNGKESSTGGYVWKYSGNVYQSQVNRTIVEKHISKVSLPNWIHKVDKFFTFCNATTNKVTNVVKSFFVNFQYTSVIPW